MVPAMDGIPSLIAMYVLFVFSTTCHEAAHAFVAQRGGDDTASAHGHVTLDSAAAHSAFALGHGDRAADRPVHHGLAARLGFGPVRSALGAALSAAQLADVAGGAVRELQLGVHLARNFARAARDRRLSPDRHGRALGFRVLERRRGGQFAAGGAGVLCSRGSCI